MAALDTSHVCVGLSAPHTTVRMFSARQSRRTRAASRLLVARELPQQPPAASAPSQEVSAVHPRVAYSRRHSRWRPRLCPHPGLHQQQAEPQPPRGRGSGRGQRPWWHYAHVRCALRPGAAAARGAAAAAAGACPRGWPPLPLLAAPAAAPPSACRMRPPRTVAYALPATSCVPHYTPRSLSPTV